MERLMYGEVYQCITANTASKRFLTFLNNTFAGGSKILLLRTATSCEHSKSSSDDALGGSLRKQFFNRLEKFSFPPGICVKVKHFNFIIYGKVYQYIIVIELFKMLLNIVNIIPTKVERGSLFENKVLSSYLRIILCKTYRKVIYQFK